MKRPVIAQHAVAPRVIVLSGGIGGAKLVLGLAQIIEGDDLLVIANTGDDFEHLGFHVSPDIDTLLYTLAGLSDPERGWGLAGESWTFMEKLRRERPQEAWFQLGDKDLETHRHRTQALAEGATLTEVTATLARRFGVGARIAPMSDDPVRTFVRAITQDGETWLPFQEYFVRHGCKPAVRALEYRGSGAASLQLLLPDLNPVRLEAVVIGPSNPFLSIDPILAIPGMRSQLRSWGAPVIAVSPIVGGRALKGPTGKIMRELGLTVDAVAIARHYRGLLDGFVIDEADREAAPAIEQLGMHAAVTPAVMNTLEDRIRLARACLDFAVALQVPGSAGSCKGKGTAPRAGRTGSRTRNEA